jgi:phytoene synthase
MLPNSSDPRGPADPASDLARCRQMLRTGSKSFFAASLLLPRRIREPASALYAFCRLADDAVDLSTEPQAALAALTERLDRAYAGSPLPFAVDRAFAHVVALHAIPRAVPDALFDGFRWDCEARRYETIADVEAYAVRVAGTVGVMMTLLMGVRDAQVLARACDLGVAMQLTNIARDVGEDARAGRLYLPRAWLREAHIAPEAFLRAPRHSDALASVIGRLLALAGEYYRRADAGIAELPGDCRPAIRAAALIYARIGHAIAASNHDSITRRAVIGKARKLGLVALALQPVAADKRDLAHPPIASASRIIAASALSPAVTAPQRRPKRVPIGESVVRVIDLFERLERRSLDHRTARTRG